MTPAQREELLRLIRIYGIRAMCEGAALAQECTNEADSEHEKCTVARKAAHTNIRNFLETL